MKMRQKKALEMAVSTIILIILGIAILIVLIFLLTSQTDFFQNFVLTVQSKTNVDLAIDSCNSLADSNQGHGFCCEKKEIITGKGKFSFTCDELRLNEISSNKIKEIDCSSVNC